MKTINRSLIPAILTAIFLNLSAINAHSIESVYSVQTGSFQNLSDARKQYDKIIQKLTDRELRDLRIEAIGKFYVVRLGRFKDHSGASKYLRSLSDRLPNARVMSVYFIKDRIIKSYKAMTTEVPEKEQFGFSKKEKEKFTSNPVNEQIKIISDMLDKYEYEMALQLSQAAIEKNPDNPLIAGWHGAVLLKMNRPESAFQFFEKAAMMSPEVSDYQSAMGYCLFFMNKNSEAIEKFNKALSLNSTNIDALAGLSVALKKEGKPEEAMEVYRRLKAIDINTAEKILNVIKQENF